jgi:hypothetical protein
MKGKHEIMMCDIFYDDFMIRCTNKYVFEWNKAYIYIYRYSWNA